MTNNSILIRFNKPIVEQTVRDSGISRIVGFISPLDLLYIVKAVGLDANPRDAKENRIIADIIETLRETPVLYPFKTKGILLAVSKCEALERERFRLIFENQQIEGILDGGHNVYAIIKYLMTELLDLPNLKTKTWADLKLLFEKHYEKLLIKLSETLKEESSLCDFFVPIEMLKPSSNTEEDITSFRDTLIDICAARNNNVQLKDETKDNKEGLYDFLKNEVLDEEISKKIIWRTNGEGDIPSTEIIALSWIVLQDFDPNFLLNKIYSAKGECVQRFGELIKKTDQNGNLLYARRNDESKIIIEDEKLKSALMLIREIPKLFDFIYKEFPASYNRAGGSFGRIKGVKMQKDSRRKFKTKYYGQDCIYKYPEGFMIPVLCSSRALIKKNDKGFYHWKEDPIEFFKKNLDELLKSYKGYMEAANWDPQSIGKTSSCYSNPETIIQLLTR